MLPGCETSGSGTNAAASQVKQTTKGNQIKRLERRNASRVVVASTRAMGNHIDAEDVRKPGGGGGLIDEEKVQKKSALDGSPSKNTGKKGLKILQRLRVCRQGFA